jgi:hypothetical protein
MWLSEKNIYAFFVFPLCATYPKHLIHLNLTLGEEIMKHGLPLTELQLCYHIMSFFYTLNIVFAILHCFQIFGSR